MDQFPSPVRLGAGPIWPRLHLVGPFRAELRPTPFAVRQNPPDRLLAGLLTEGASLTGTAYVESPHTALERRPVRLSRTGRQTLIIPHAFAFRLPGSGLVEQLGLFDEDGRLLFFGNLRSPRQAVERPETFDFPEGAVTLLHERVTTH
ncbi:MAG: hypothetical protein DI624_06465 [Brevundimonas sp.]|uniref:hypothetical protein n=1 Tax=Brevundimonas sp. TaxID=1871086 RepID=UPI000DB409EA|nr:hypothetical protein [Brevundimonas sp.]PZT98996.1 MAG: hypothetical protein DI624_06465 [Brevundimonas sp.]